MIIWYRIIPFAEALCPSLVSNLERPQDFTVVIETQREPPGGFRKDFLLRSRDTEDCLLGHNFFPFLLLLHAC